MIEEDKSHGDYHDFNDEIDLEEDLDDKSINILREFFTKCMEKNNTNKYSETFIVRKDGHLSSEKRAGDNRIPFLANWFIQVQRTPKGELKTRSVKMEQFYKIIKHLEEKLLEFKFKIEVDPQERRWIKYEVIKKE